MEGTTMNTTTALEVREKQAPRPGGIRLPEEMPSPAPEITPEEADPKPTVAQIPKNELRLVDEAKNAPAPSKVLESVPVVKPSLVVPVQLATEPLAEALDALARIAEDRASNYPILRNVRLTYSEGTLLAEAT